jgi:hypothetical protein
MISSIRATLPSPRIAAPELNVAENPTVKIMITTSAADQIIYQLGKPVPSEHHRKQQGIFRTL